MVQAARPLGGCPPDPGVGVAMHGQLGPRRLADRGRVGPAAGRDRPGDGGREPFEQAAGRGRRLRYPLDRLGHPDRRRQEVNPRRERADHAQLERPGRDREQAPGRGQVVGRERRADVVGPGERRGAERALLVPLEAGDPGGGERRAEERLVHGGDELGGGRHLEQAERLVDLLAQRQQRPRPGGRLVRRAVAPVCAANVSVCSGAASSSASSHARSADLRADRRCAASARSPARTASRTATRSSSIRRSSASMVSATAPIIPAARCDFQQSPAWERPRRGRRSRACARARSGGAVDLRKRRSLGEPKLLSHGHRLAQAPVRHYRRGTTAHVTGEINCDSLRQRDHPESWRRFFVECHACRAFCRARNR